MRTINIRNNCCGANIISVDNDSTFDEMMNTFKWYTERYTDVTFIVDLSDSISLKSIQRLIKALKKIAESDHVYLDMTLRCDKLLREYNFYNDIIEMMEERD